MRWSWLVVEMGCELISCQIDDDMCYIIELLETKRERRLDMIK